MFFLNICSKLRREVVQTPEEKEQTLGKRLRVITSMVEDKLENACWACVLEKGLDKLENIMFNAANGGDSECIITFSVDVELVRKRDKAFECMTNVTIKRMLSKVVRTKLVRHFIEQELGVHQFPEVAKINENESKIHFKFKISWY